MPLDKLAITDDTRDLLIHRDAGDVLIGKALSHLIYEKRTRVVACSKAEERLVVETAHIAQHARKRDGLASPVRSLLSHDHAVTKVPLVNGNAVAQVLV